MRPMRLTMTAFGPYVGTEIVDFTPALDAGIFGIYGETGAGKTTIFDGISFALFGQSSGAERSAEDMVCHHAHATDITEVELVFDLGNERYVIRRIPKQERAARRGSGTTTEPHQAFLFRATSMSLEEIASDNVGEIIAEKQVNKVDPEIERLLGYNAAQFRQIVLLPQGDFRKILTATNDERSPILKRLFDVRLYEGFVDRIKRDAAALYREISAERVRRETLLNDQSEEELGEAIRSMREEIATLAGTVKSEVEVLEQCQKALSAGEGLAEKFEAQKLAKDEETSLLSEANAVKESKSRLAKARAAQTVLVAEAAMRSAGEEAKASQTRHVTAKDTLSSAQSVFSSAKEALNRTGDQKNDRDAAHVRVQELGRFEKTLGQARNLLADLGAATANTKSAAEKQAVADSKRRDTEQALAALRNLQKEQPAEIAVLPHGAEVEAGDAERLRSDLGVPAIKTAEEQIRRTVRQRARLNRIHIVDQEEKDLAIGGVERRRVLGDIDARVVDAGRPVEHARYLPACVTDAVASDALDGGNQLVIVDAAIVEAGDSAEFCLAICDFHGLDLLGAMVGQAVLQIDTGEWCRELAHVGRRGADKARELTKAPMGRRDRCLGVRQDEHQPFRIVAMGFDADRGALYRPRPTLLGAAPHRGVKLREGQELLIVGSREPL